METTKWTESPIKYGWVKDKFDSRDLFHKFSLCQPFHTVTKIDLRNQCPPIYDQGQFGSCTANAIAAAYEFDEIKRSTNMNFNPSRLFIYYNERELEGTTNEDAGAELRDGIKSINKAGICSDDMWPYDEKNLFVKPSHECYTCAQKHRSVEYKRVEQNLTQIRLCLINGFPFVFGIVAYPGLESQETAKTGLIPLPKSNEQSIGGHAMMAVGFDDKRKLIIVQNSWGNQWGDNGFGYLPYEYILNCNLAADFWTITKIMDENKEKTIIQPQTQIQTEIGIETETETETDTDLDSDSDEYYFEEDVFQNNNGFLTNLFNIINNYVFNFRFNLN